MNLKQKIALGLCTFYLLSVIGVALSMHFCGGKLATVSVYSSKIDCKFCKAETASKGTDGCCKNTKVEVKVKDDHHAQASLKLPKLFGLDIFLPVRTFETLDSAYTLFRNKFLGKAPPLIQHVAKHVLYCVFRN